MPTSLRWRPDGLRGSHGRMRRIDDSPPGIVRNVGIADLPFLGHLPVEHLGATRHFVTLEGDQALDEVEGAPDPVAGNAPADRIHLGHHADPCSSSFARPFVGLESSERHG